MDIRFECIFEGKRLFQVVRPEGEIVVFTGTFAQCKRFQEVYQEKVARSKHRDRKAARPALAAASG
jgi:hypothetical protein